MSDPNCICFRCRQPLIEMNSYGQLLWGCVNCKLWWLARGPVRSHSSPKQLPTSIKSNPKFRLDNRNWRISGESICWLPHSALACGKVRLIIEFSLEEAPAAWTLAGASRSFGVLARGPLPILAEALLRSYDDKFPVLSAWSNRSGVQSNVHPFRHGAAPESGSYSAYRRYPRGG